MHYNPSLRREASNMPQNIAMDTTLLERHTPVTSEGREIKETALELLRHIRTEEDVMRILIRVGLFREDGTPNPYFYPEEEMGD